MVDLSIVPTAYADGKSEDGDSNSSQLDAGGNEAGNKVTAANEQCQIREESATYTSGKIYVLEGVGHIQHQLTNTSPNDTHLNHRYNGITDSSPDTRDEEEEDTLYGGRWPMDDPYVYSDDSASLSDAYFFPQSDDDRSARHRHEEYGSLIGDSSHNQSHQYPLANYYGSMSRDNNQSNSTHGNYSHTSQSSLSHGLYHGASEQRAPSPLWITAGSIQEDAEEVFPLKPFAALQLYSEESLKSFLVTKPRQEKRRQRRSKRGWIPQQQVQQTQRERQAERERLVNQVRGRPQNSKARDVVWAYLFLVQFSSVCFCAFYFGGQFVSENSSLNWIFYLPNPVAKGNFHHFAGDNQINNRGAAAVIGSAKATIPVLVQNTTTDELQYNEKLLHNETSMKRPPLTTIDVVSSLSAEVIGNDEAFQNLDKQHPIDYENVLALLSVTGFYACVISYASFLLMLLLSRAVIQIMLIFSVMLALSWGMIGLSLDPYGAISILGFTSLLLTLGYSMFHWQRVPFAATNLNTALNALRCTADVACLGFGGLVVAFAWSMTWTVAFIGIVNALNASEHDEYKVGQPTMTLKHIPVYMILFVSYHWTNTVVKNVLRVTISTLIGTWWFYPRDIGYCCSAAVAKPLLRSLTLSFGSICLGSLVVQPAQLITIMSNYIYCKIWKARTSVSVVASQVNSESKKEPYLSANEEDEDDENIDECHRLACAPSRCVATLASFNRWSYTYIGMYGYGFAEAGALALQLFETREWLDVVKDGLIQNVLLMASVVIGGTTGTLAVVIDESNSYEFSYFQKPVVCAFVCGSLLGYVLSNILLLGVIGSAANTVLVCFAAGPFEFDKNHPKLSREMREIWSQQVWEPSI